MFYKQIYQLVRVVILLVYTALPACRIAQAQEKPLKSSSESFYTTLQLSSHEQYIGAGMGYRFMPKTWLGVQAQVEWYPEMQNHQDQVSGGGLLQTSASLLVGHRWKRFAVYGEGGGGVLRSDIYAGDALGSFDPIYDRRYLADVLFGGLLEMFVSRRWGLTFNIRDNLLFLGPYRASTPYQQFDVPTGTLNAPEARAGVAFHF